MTFVLDTDILIAYIRSNAVKAEVENRFDPFAAAQTPIISSVTEGELESLALQLDWGLTKRKALVTILEQTVVIHPGVRSIIDRYAEIDAFSQGRHPDKRTNFSSRNMGKNDLWIAATASILEVPLLTTDADFRHLDKEFLQLHYIDTKR